MIETPPPSRTPRWRLGAGAVLVIVLLVLGVTVVIGIVRGGGGEALPGETVAATAGPGGAGTTVAGTAAYVHVAGAVARPGLYALPAGARVVDAISAAGGFTPEAAQAAVNLARSVTDGEQLVVPVQGAAPPAGATPGDGRVNVNTADAARLDTLPGVGPAIADRIVSWREKNGPFASIDDLLAVPGIGEKMLENLRELVSV
ncbi:ComEA family DNA-binding protein [Microbacterium sp. X-17]|uniref:ComEA family DNA-binding protein n=1 Tax=Microbacterium sp. X-17 TaxID=3144404 RepID=UPI0031F53AB8